MDRRIQVVHKTLAILGDLLVFVLAVGLLVGCGGSQSESGNAIPSSPEDANNVVVRVSGAQGTAYSGDYGTISGEPQIVDSTLGSDPTEYKVDIEKGTSDGVTAFFQKTQSGGGELKAEILADGETVVESRTRAEFGSVVVDWLPESGAPGEIPPDEEGS